MQRLKHLSEILPNSRVVLYGAGSMGNLVMKELKTKRPDINIKYFVDTHKVGYLNNVKIISQKELINVKSEYDLILVTSFYWKEIAGYLILLLQL